MTPSMGRPVAGLLAALALAVATPAAAREDAGSSNSGFHRAARISWDLLIWRPLGLIRTGFSIAAFPVCYPVAAPFGAEDHCRDYLWREPIYATFQRPLGE